jgi:hypothetical protein
LEPSCPKNEGKKELEEDFFLLFPERESPLEG